jgi:hypothetical protein
MGTIIRSEVGGFEFQALQGYETKDHMGIVTMYLPDGDHQSGPGMLLIGSLFDQDVSLEQAIAVEIKSSPAYEFSEPQKIQVDGQEGTVLDFSTTYRALDGVILDHPGASEGDIIRGRVILIMLNARQQFKCVMLAPAKDWDNISPRFEKVIQSLEFFAID